MDRALTVPLAVAGMLLVLAGVAKLRAPGPASTALAVARLPGGEPLVRAASAIELVAGAYVVAGGGRVAAALVLLAFIAFIAVTARIGSQARSCGCFGALQTPGSSWHLALCALFAGIGACGLAWPPAALASAGDPLAVSTAVVASVGACYAAKLAYVELPGAWRAWSGVAHERR